jgi:hypothetical protein
MEMKLRSMMPDHPAGKLLETLFYRWPAIDNEATFREAGFHIRRKKERSLMRVATHPAAPGYVFKVFFVEERGCQREKPRDWRSFAVRCEQAKQIRRVIDENALQYFTVPRKWLFHTPPHPACDDDDQPAILVAEFQDLLLREQNEHAWTHSITETHLDELYAIIERAGGSSYRPDNIRLTRQGRFAFIDTEHTGSERDFQSITPYLSSSMRRYWSNLVQYLGK